MIHLDAEIKEKVNKQYCQPVSWQPVRLDIFFVDEGEGMAESSVEEVERLVAFDARVIDGPVGTPEKVYLCRI